MLVTFLQQRGYKLNHEGQGNYRVVGMQGLIVKEDYWYQHSQQKGGHAIQLIMQLENINFKNAKRIFENTLAFSEKAFILEEHPDGCSLKNKTITYDTVGYLVNKRKIDKRLVIDLIDRNYISQDHHNNICFIGYDKNKNIKCISKRAISPKSPLQKFDDKGSDKRYSFSIPAEQSNADIVLTEGPIDALSVACLEHRKNKNTYYKTHKIALCGSSTKHLPDRIKKLNPSRIWICLDNDNTGKRLSLYIFDSIKHIAKTKIVTPTFGKDPNDWLIATKNN